MSTLATLVVKLVGDVSGFRSDMESAGETVRNVGRGIGDVGGDLTRRLTLPIVGAGTAAVLMGNQFNDGMANVVSLVPEASTEIAGMAEDVQQLAIDMGQSTGDMTAGLYQQISATGYSADSLDMLRINATAAAAGLSTTREAIDLTSAVTRGYGDTTADATQKAADLALKTVQMGQTTFPELASSIGRVVPLAAQLGVSQEELFATMATGAGVTGSASEVATQYRGIMQSLMAPTESMSALLADFGYENGAAAIEAQGLAGFLGDVVDAANETGTPLQQYIGSIEGQTLALALAGPLHQDFVTKLESMGTAAGTTQAAFDAQTQGVNAAGFAMQQAGIQVQVMAQQVGNALGPAVLTIIPYVQQFIGWIQGIVQRFTELDPKTQGIILGVIGLAAAIGPLLMVLGPIVTGFGAVVTVLGALLSPIGLVVVAVVGLAAIVVQHFGGIQNTIQAVVGFVQNILDGLSSFVQGNGAEIGGWIDEAWSRVRSIVEGVVYYVRQIVESIFGAVASFINAHGAEIQAFMQQAWDRIGVIINLALQLIQATVVPILRGIAQFISEHGAEIQRVLEFAWNAIRTVIDTVLTIIEGILRTALAVLRGDWDGAWQIIRQTVERVWGTIRSLIETALTAISRFIDEKLQEIRNWFTERWEAIQNYLRSINLAEIGRGIIQGLIDGVRSMAQSLIDAATNVVQNAIDAAKRLLGIHSPSVVFQQIGQDSMAGLGLGITTGGTTALQALENTVDALTEIAGDIPDDLAQQFGVFSDIAEGFNALVRGPAGDVRPVIEAWRQQIQYVIRMLSQIWQNWDDPNVMRNAKQAAEVIDAIAQPWVKLSEAVAAMAQGAAPGIRDSLGRWEVVVIEIVRMMARIASTVGQSVGDAAERMAEIVTTVAQPWVDLAAAFVVMARGPAPGIRTSLARWEVVVIEIVRALARMAIVIGQSAAAANMAEMLRNIAASLRDAMENLRELGGVPLDDIAAATRHAGITWVNGFIHGILFRLPELWDQILNVRGMLDDIDVLTPGITLGRNWIDGIVTGIRQGLPDLQSAIDGAIDRLYGKLNLPTGNNGRLEGGQAAQAVTVNLYGPWNVRDQGDIEAIAQRVAEMLGQRTAAVRRVTV